MKKFSLSLVFIALYAISYSQDLYVITTVGQTYSVQQVKEAIESDDFCGYYYTDERHLLVFNDGTEVELKSNDELILEGYFMPSECYTLERKENPVVWTIDANNTIIRGTPNTGRIKGSN